MLCCSGAMQKQKETKNDADLQTGLKSFIELLDNTQPRFGMEYSINFRNLIEDPDLTQHEGNWDNFIRELDRACDDAMRYFDEQVKDIHERTEAVPIADPDDLNLRDADRIERDLSKLYSRHQQLETYVGHNFSMAKTLVRYWAAVHPSVGEEQDKKVDQLKDNNSKDVTRLDALQDKLQKRSEENGVDAQGRAARFQKQYHKESGLSYFLLGIQGVLLFQVLLVLIFIFPDQHQRDDFDEEEFNAVLPVFRCSFMMALLLWCAVGVLEVFERFDINFAWILNFPAKLEVTARSLSVLAHIQLLLFSLPFLCFLHGICFKVISRSANRRAYYPMISAFGSIVLWFVPLKCMPWMGMARTGLRQCLCLVLFPTTVTFASNLLGDVLTSFVKPLKDVVYTGCYMWTWRKGHVVTLDDCAKVQGTFATMLILNAPLAIRWIQCWRRATAASTPTERQGHLLNVGKYSVSLLTSIVAFVDWEARGWTPMQKNILLCICYIGATLYSLLWDIWKDWSLSIRGGFIRELPHGGVTGCGTCSSQTRKAMLYNWKFYVVAAFLDTLGRSTWATTLMPADTFFTGHLQEQVFTFVISSVEVLRRSLWTLIRMENEQVTNASGYRPKELAWVPARQKEKVGESLMEGTQAAKMAAKPKGKKLFKQTANKLMIGAKLHRDSLGGKTEGSCREPLLP